MWCRAVKSSDEAGVFHQQRSKMFLKRATSLKRCSLLRFHDAPALACPLYVRQVLQLYMLNGPCLVSLLPDDLKFRSFSARVAKWKKPTEFHMQNGAGSNPAWSTSLSWAEEKNCI